MIQTTSPADSRQNPPIYEKLNELFREFGSDHGAGE
jgi:hypothetical protein